MASIRGTILVDTISPTLDYLAVNAASNVAEAMEQGKDKIEYYAQSNAPWADQTGAARAGLTADVHVEGSEIILELSHSVDYGIWLETIQEGAYAIIMPTLEALGPEIVHDAGGHIVGMSMGGLI